ncbi:MAG TPA: class I SAM-dependent rRNA methyltransferase [Rectinemataceae bacterium]|nr:class I SAM-dependent rRNA methyltransferase [Rectinemataceae bacterium]
MSIPTVTLKPREEVRIRRGHPWIYDNEIALVEGNPEAGGEVRALDSRGKPLGFGFYNPASKIRVRLFSKSAAKADKEFFVETFKTALAWRAQFFDTEKQSFRAVFGEADSAPGLIVDLFAGTAAGEPLSGGAVPDAPAPGKPGRWLSTQFLSLGVERRKTEIVAALQAVFSPDGIAERSDAPVRALEGLAPSSGLLAGWVPESIIMNENGAKFSVDIAGGQKTGWFLDQRANRAAAARFASGKNVLDVFCNQGGFGILCALSGAVSVTAVDSSAGALAAAALNASLNGVASTYVTVEANAFDHLRALEKDGSKYDLVILDPPAFAKSHSAVEAAYRGYKEINVRAMHLLRHGGILVTCSCSHWFDEARFDSMLSDAAFDCGRRFRVIDVRAQDLDHPIISGYGESRYLKCRILEVL